MKQSKIAATRPVTRSTTKAIENVNNGTSSSRKKAVKTTNATVKKIENNKSTQTTCRTSRKRKKVYNESSTNEKELSEPSRSTKRAKKLVKDESSQNSIAEKVETKGSDTDLPVIVVNTILNYLDVNTILKCRLLNKYWKAQVDDFKIIDLAIPRVMNGGRWYPYCEQKFEVKKLYPTNKLIKDHANVFVTKNLNFFQSELMKSMLSELRVLYVENAPHGYSTFSLDSNINHLKTLEKLQFDFLDTIKGRSLKLPNLRVLMIDKYTKENGLKMQCKNLQEFRTRVSLDHFIFVYPEKMSSLYLRSLDMYYRNEENLKQFINLERLTVELGAEIPENIFQIFTKLVDLRIKEISEERIAKLLKLKTTLKRLNLTIYLCGIPIETNDEIDEYFCNIEKKGNLTRWTQLIARKYDRLTDFLPWIKEINYSEIYAHFNCNIPNEFFERFTEIEHIAITQPIANADHFEAFIGKYKATLKQMDFHSTIDQSIFDQLHKWKNDFEILKIYNAELIDLNFLRNQTKLTSLFVDKELPVDLLFELKDDIEKVKTFYFKYNNKNAKINLYGRPYTVYKLELTVDGHNAFFRTMESMFNFLKYFI